METLDANENGETVDKTTSDFVLGLKERESLKKELEEKTRELNRVKGQNYDLVKKVEDLEKQVADLKSDVKSQIKRPKSGMMSKKKVAKRKVPRKSKQKDGLLSLPSTGGSEDIFEDTDKLYAAIAEKFPELTLSTVLIAEKKFIEADTDKSGTIDAKELETILDTSQMLFTKDQVNEILESIDSDNTKSIDFFECLEALDLVYKNRKTGLPQSLQKNKSAVCVIQ
ncbi:uncharacterized protein LOC135693430 [Rhopilema esculentum]|uniref:uncharacterized protein LOC135693430 n=1 Tax=Rhopilema esculentum TaxID=499914 RepID=UPI0031DE4765|eukprot:gene2705-917_t